MIKGSIYMSYDPQLSLANLGKCKTIVIADEPEMFNIPGKIGGSILLPPYDAMAALVDNSYNDFEYIYMNYLMNDITVTKFVDIIIQALLVGTNMIFLMEPDMKQCEMVLKNFFISLGIYIGDDKHQFQYDMRLMHLILNRLYANDSINAEYFLRLYPYEVGFDPFILRKLSYNYGIYFTNDAEMSFHFKHRSIILKGGKIQDVISRPEQ